MQEEGKGQEGKEEEITLVYRELLGAVFDGAAVSLQEQGTSNSLRQIWAMKYPRTEKFQVAKEIYVLQTSLKQQQLTASDSKSK